MDIKTHTAKHESFARLSKSQRELAYRAVRAQKPQGMICIDELIAAHQGLLGRARE
jgi:hypothetical protein